MELKKNIELDLEKKTPLFFSIGLVIALSLVAVAFEWRSEYVPIDIVPNTEKFEENYVPDITVQKKPEAPKPIEKKVEKPKPNQPPVIVSVEDTKTIEKTLEPETEPIDLNNLILDDGPIEVAEAPPFVIVEAMPEFPGGDAAFLGFLAQNIVYPRRAKTVGAEGTVYLEFIVSTDGSVSDVKVIKGIGSQCDEEAARVVTLSPNWTPGKQRGVPVRVKKIVPVRFILE